MEHEITKSVYCRMVKYSFEIFKVKFNSNSPTKVDLELINNTQTCFGYFYIGQKSDSNGITKFCKLSDLFPNN